MKILVPFNHTVLTSRLGSEAVRSCIAQALGPKPSWWEALRGWRSDRQYFGRPTRRGFWLVMGRAYVNTYRPVVVLQVSPSTKGTSIDSIAFAPCAILMPIPFILVSVIAIRNGQWDMLGILWLIWAAFHAISLVFYERERREVIAHLIGLWSSVSTGPESR